ncbi:hypothetical protein SLEP1_g32433 [Rubroshorea leprosula]|uniref:Uncharacterized protein n=1 Tax=Rubroshorea leprosula TaxID=152421 RepID=A0AAV5KD99_9ROSI|nr:hypothetical protein SLEP1_g32433 [Rubroshorea leprosula]
MNNEDEEASFELTDLLKASAEGLGKRTFGNTYKAMMVGTRQVSRSCETPWGFKTIEPSSSYSSMKRKETSSVSSTEPEEPGTGFPSDGAPDYLLLAAWHEHRNIFMRTRKRNPPSLTGIETAAKRVSKKSVVWTYGCLSLELLTGRMWVNTAPAGINGVDLCGWVHRAVREERTAEILDLEIAVQRSSTPGW